jgi:hypothetical protein
MRAGLRLWVLICAVLAVACGSGGTVERVDAGAPDARVTVGDSGVDSAAVVGDSGAGDSTVSGDGPSVETSTPTDTSAPDDTSTPDTSVDAPADTTQADATVPADSMLAADTVTADSPPPLFTVGGTVAGSFADGVTLQDNGGDNITVPMDGSFTFPTPLPTGAAFNVTILDADCPALCQVTGGSGVIANGNVTSIVVTCDAPVAASAFVGGTVMGLSGTLVLANNGGDLTTITSNGVFMFSMSLGPCDRSYDVTVASQPTAQVCTVTSGTGTASFEDVTNVEISCVPATYTVSVEITGLAGTIVFADNGTDLLTESSSGTFTFALPLASGSPFAVTVAAEPFTQTCCPVSPTSGTIRNANVTVDFACSTATFTLGGTVAGLPPGESVVLVDSDGEADTITFNGGFTFLDPLRVPSPYAVTVQTQPTSATCTVSAGTGTAGCFNVTSILVTCLPASVVPVGGTITGLAPGDSVRLELNGGESTFFASNGAFAFPTGLAAGDTYAITIQNDPAAPTAQTCTVTSGTGIVGSPSSAIVSCVTNSYTLAGSVTLVGAGSDSVSLTDGTGDEIVIPPGSSSPAPFAFPTPILSGSPYTVVATPVGGTAITCTSASGTVGSQNVTGIAIQCAP